MISIVPLLALAAYAPQSADFEVVHRAVVDQDIAFVHVESESPELVLGVYSESEQISAWPSTIVVNEPISLVPGEKFWLDELHRMLTAVQIGYPCLGDGSVSGLAQFTQLRFPRPVLPPLPPQPQPWPAPNPPPPVDGANTVHISADAALIVFVQGQRNLDQATTVTVFRLPDPSAGSYELAGTYTNEGQGAVRSSLGGALLAQRQGREVRVLLPTGSVQAGLPLEGAFDLAPDAAWLARTTPVRAVFDALDVGGRPTGQQVSMPTASRPLGIDMRADGLAIVRERRTVTLFDVTTQQVIWSRSSAQGIYLSADVVELVPGRRLIGLGRRELLQAPMRRDGAFVPGQARAYAEVIDVSSDQVLLETTFLLNRWGQGAPRVQFVGAQPRLLVSSPESALISQVVQ